MLRNSPARTLPIALVKICTTASSDRLRVSRPSDPPNKADAMAIELMFCPLFYCIAL